MLASSYDEAKGLIMAISLLIIAVTGAIVLVILVWKGRGFVAQWREFKVTVNPQTLTEFSNKMDEVVKSVNGAKPPEPTLFQTVKIHTSQLRAVNQRLDRIDNKLSTKMESVEQVNRKLDLVMHHVGLSDNQSGE